jgi:prepilin-type N-terminal cleavage/methylation domain-containing protein
MAGTSPEAGFSLIESLIAMAISGLVLGAIFSFMIVQRQYLVVQEQVTAMVQGARAALDMVAADIAMAGYSPTGAAVVGVPYQGSALELRADLNGNGVVTDPGETTRYTYDPEGQRLLRNSGDGDQPVAEPVQAFTVAYLDAAGNPTMVTAEVRQIRLTLTMRTAKPDPSYPTNGGHRAYTLTSVVTPRNLAP